MSTTLSLVKRHPLATLFVLVGALAWLLEDRAWAVGGWTGLRANARDAARRLHRLVPAAAGAVAPRRARAGQDRGRRMWRVTSGYLLAFFDRHLRDEPSPLLDGPSPDHPEVVLGAPEVLFEAERPTNAG